ncbi:hypothetical protein ABZ916_41950 [Streptomyces sp. NPDC046853]|uniref:hypothetical protein n=1 Tax=Streptomyces sp. NPDC046853 TaxID=3154920 RepID=UPI0033E65F4A
MKLTAQPRRGPAKRPQRLHLIRLDLLARRQSEHGGVGPLTLGELRRRGIEDGPQHDAVGAGMFGQQSQEPVVVPSAVTGRAQFQKCCGRGTSREWMRLTGQE